MMSREATLGLKTWREQWQRGPWLHSKTWDLSFILCSSVLVIIPLILYEFLGRTATFINLFIAGVIGGPHMYSTFFRTAFDSDFRQRYRFFLLSSLLIPIAVVAGALWHFQLLLTLFFFWASIHVLHQIAYIMECYTRKNGASAPSWARFIDYAVVFSSLFPFATYKFIHSEFFIGSTLLLYPEVLKIPVLYYAIAGFFALALALFLGKTVYEIRQGIAHYPKILLVLITVAVTFLITSYSGHKLEIAFQGFNTWHSFQYLALTWYINTLHQKRGIVRQVSPSWLAPGRSQNWREFYGINVLLTFASLVLIGSVFTFSRLSFEQSYYTVVLSFLLVHYYHDHILFTRFGDVVKDFS